MDGTVSRGASGPVAGDAPATRLTRLDGLRGLAACGVAFLYHPQTLFAPGASPGWPVNWFQDWGWTLVDLFFLISGYIFAHVYLPSGGAEDGGRGLTREGMAAFAVARVARLYPLHLAMLLLCAVLFADAPGNTLLAFAAHLVMLQAFVQPIAHTFDGPSWSISVEVVCYVLFALGAVGGKRTLRWVTAIAIGGALLHFVLQGRPGGPWVGDGLPRGLLGFFLGQVLWHLRGPLARVPCAVLAALLGAGILVDMGGMSSLLPLCLMAWPATLLLALRLGWMGSAPMRWLGDRSYGIYLIHLPVLQLIEQWIAPLPADPATFVAATLAFAAVVLALSDLSYRLLETPARKSLRAAWLRRTGSKAKRAAHAV